MSRRPEPKEDISARGRCEQTVLRSYDKSAGVNLVHRDVDPQLALEVAPRLAGRCVHVRVQRYSDGAYRHVRRTDCIQLNRYSKARWTLTGSPAVGVRYRLRYEAPGDPRLAGAVAPWAHLKFTR